MEKLSDFFKTIKDRLSNPLIYSFIFSWLIINWKIVIGLLLYKNTDLYLDGYKSYMDLISQNIDSDLLIYHPLLVAIFYTFAFPFIRNGIYAFNSWIKAWGDKLNINLSRKSKVSMSKYLDLRETYEKRTKLLEKVLGEESNYINENAKLNTEILILKDIKNDSAQDIYFLQEKLKASTDTSILNGEWEFSYTGVERINADKFYIMNGMLEYIDSSTSKTVKSQIKNFINNSSKNISFFISTDFNNSHSYTYYYLEIFDNMKLLRGRENEIFTVEFRKR